MVTEPKLHLARIAGVGVMVLALATIMLWVLLRPESLLATYIYGQLETTPDEQVERQVAVLSQLDGAALHELVTALASPRPSLIDAAEGALHGLLDRWQQLPSEAASRNVARLADELAHMAPRLGARQRAIAEALALRILQWPLDRNAVNRSQVIAHCKTIIRPSGKPSRNENPAMITSAGTSAANAAGGSDHGSPFLLRPRLPGSESSLPANSPVGSTVIGSPPATPAHLGLSDGIPAGSADVLNDEATRALPAGPQPPTTPPAAPSLDVTSRPAPSESTRTDTEPGMLPDKRGTPSDTIVARALPGLTPDLRAEPPSGAAPVTDRDLIDDLVHPDRSVERSAELELYRRGYRKLEIELGRRLAGPDPVERRQLADALAGLPVERRRWLLWLSGDPDAQVRRSAVSLMATSSDPVLTTRLEELLTQENDPEVRRLLQRWAQIRDRTRR